MSELTTPLSATETPPETIESDAFPRRPWLEAAGFWLVLASTLVWWLGAADSRLLSRFWLLSAICLVGLLATARVVRGMLALASGVEKNSFFALIRASSWGSIKLASLGLLGLLIWRSREASPLPVIFGLATLIAVPLLGGIRGHWLNQKYRKAILHAR